MSTPENRALSEEIFKELCGNGQTAINAINAINEFTRVKMREDNFYRRILPPVFIGNDATYPFPYCKTCAVPQRHLHQTNPNRLMYDDIRQCYNCNDLTIHSCTDDLVEGDSNYNHQLCQECGWYKFDYMPEYVNPATTLDLSFPTDLPL